MKKPLYIQLEPGAYPKDIDWQIMTPANRGYCTRFPKWEDKSEHGHCGEFKIKEQEEENED